MAKRVLMIAYHYPPVRGSSGVHRTLQFSRHLYEHGWEPIVLTVHPRAYRETSPDQLKAIDPRTVVHRAFALDTTRHLSIRGRYPRFLALPDAWTSWWYGGVWSGRRLIRKYEPEAIWSTFPIATAHRIGATLQRASGLPWIADFRDSMTEPNFPHDTRVRRAFRRVEQRTVKRCQRAVFTAPGAARMYAERYPELPADRWTLISNGYDEESFEQAGRTEPPPANGRPLRLVHAGLLYPFERNPNAFFVALGNLRKQGVLGPDNLRVVLRATGHDEFYRQRLNDLGVADLVDLQPSLLYSDALAEMQEADGLLIFQGSSCNRQIPAKLYEYLRARRPILALTDEAGDTADAIRESGVGTVVPLGDLDRITEGLHAFVRSLREGTTESASDEYLEQHTRRALTGRLAALLDEVSGG